MGRRGLQLRIDQHHHQPGGRRGERGRRGGRALVARQDADKSAASPGREAGGSVVGAPGVVSGPAGRDRESDVFFLCRRLSLPVADVSFPGRCVVRHSVSDISHPRRRRFDPARPVQRSPSLRRHSRRHLRGLDPSTAHRGGQERL